MSIAFYDPTGTRYGLPTYPYRLAPDGLYTPRQLAARGLTRGRQEIAAQILWRRGERVAYLYRLDLAIPKRPASPANLAALEKANAARRTCDTCRREVDHYISRRYGECFDCHNGFTHPDETTDDEQEEAA